MKRNNFTPKNLILDVDGVFTDGSYYYTEKGKIMKKFGPEDNDAISLLKGKMHVHAITADKRGYAITKKRINIDMGLPLNLVGVFERVDWIEKKFKTSECIYMGDGIFDSLVFKKVYYSIAPANAFFKTRLKADFVTKSRGGEGAVAEAVLHILYKFFKYKFNVDKIGLSSDISILSKSKIGKK